MHLQVRAAQTVTSLATSNPASAMTHLFTLKQLQDAFALGLRLPRDYLSRTGYRLPTEAEWEFAARAGATTARYYGQTEELLPRYAVGRDPVRDHSRPVGLLKPNDYGLFDTLGNLVEWCQDGSPAGSRYRFAPPGEWMEDTEDAEGLVLDDKQPRVLRGGPAGDSPGSIRCNLRDWTPTDYSTIAIGFRVARTIR
jgi:formylglycine-generating enzyme required for sulfatase activity